MTPNESTVCIVDDEEAVRTAITDLLESARFIVQAYASGREFLESLSHDIHPCCLILDVRLAGSSGLEFHQELTRRGIEIPIVFITGHGDIPMAVQAMKRGAVDFLTKPFRDQELLDAIDRAIQQGQSDLQKQASLQGVQSRFESLTPREREVMMLVVQGLLNKQIAAELGTSETTVKAHRGQVMRKMLADSLPDLVRMADKILRSAE